MARKNRHSRSARENLANTLSLMQIHELHNKAVINKRLGNNQVQSVAISKSSYSAIDHPVLYHGALSHQEADAAMRVAQARTILTDKHGTILLF